MTFLIGWAAKAVGQRFAPFLVYGGFILIALAALWWLRHDAYKDGERATDTKWEEAGRKLEEQAAAAAGTASAASVQRIKQNNERVAQEKEKIDEAQADGSSPLDALFGG